jgi:hypothetical protein
LRPEESLTEMFGFVVSPGGAVEGMRFSADYYEITIAGGQRLDGAPTVINGCFVLNQPEQCARITFGLPLVPGFPTSNIDEVESRTSTRRRTRPRASTSRSTIRSSSRPARSLSI